MAKTLLADTWVVKEKVGSRVASPAIAHFIRRSRLGDQSRCLKYCPYQCYILRECKAFTMAVRITGSLESADLASCTEVLVTKATSAATTICNYTNIFSLKFRLYPTIWFKYARRYLHEKSINPTEAGIAGNRNQRIFIPLVTVWKWSNKVNCQYKKNVR